MAVRPERPPEPNSLSVMVGSPPSPGVSRPSMHWRLCSLRGDPRRPEVGGRDTPNHDDFDVMTYGNFRFPQTTKPAAGGMPAAGSWADHPRCPAALS